MKMDGGLRNEEMSIKSKVMLYGKMGKDFCPHWKLIPVFDDPHLRRWLLP